MRRRLNSFTTIGGLKIQLFPEDSKIQSDGDRHAFPKIASREFAFLLAPVITISVRAPMG